MSKIIPFPTRATVRLSPRKLARRPKATVHTLPLSADRLHAHAADIDDTEPGRARIMYLAALQSDPKHALSMTNLGNLAFKAGRTAEAREWFQRAYAVDPKQAEAPYNLGYLNLATGPGPRSPISRVNTAIGVSTTFDPASLEQYAYLVTRPGNA